MRSVDPGFPAHFPLLTPELPERSWRTSRLLRRRFFLLKISVLAVSVFFCFVLKLLLLVRCKLHTNHVFFKTQLINQFVHLMFMAYMSFLTQLVVWIFSPTVFMYPVLFVIFSTSRSQNNSFGPLSHPVSSNLCHQRVLCPQVSAMYSTSPTSQYAPNPQLAGSHRSKPVNQNSCIISLDEAHCLHTNHTGNEGLLLFSNVKVSI